MRSLLIAVCVSLTACIVPAPTSEGTQGVKARPPAGPPQEFKSGANFGDSVELVSTIVAPGSAYLGDTVRVGLNFKVLKQMDVDYMIFVHVEDVDGRTDLYSLGVTLFQLLTGRLPCQADSLGALMRAIARETPPNVCELRPELPATLGDVVALALQKHPATRYSSGEQMAEDLRAVLKMLPDAGAPGVDISLA